MKIRLFFFLFSSLLIHTKQLCAQTNEFAPIGAKWWYTAYRLVPGLSYPEIRESVRDTVIQSKTCKIIASNIFPTFTIYIYQEDKQIYRYFEADSQFKLLIDFSKVAGETYWIFSDSISESDSILITVLSTQIITIDGVDLIQQNISKEGNYYWGETNIEKIGILSILYLFGALMNSHQDHCDVMKTLQLGIMKQVLWKIVI